MKVYALMEFTTVDMEGNQVTVQPGEPVSLPNNTLEESAEIDRLLDHGIVTRTAPKPSKDDSEDSESGQRTRRSKD